MTRQYTDRHIVLTQVQGQKACGFLDNLSAAARISDSVREDIEYWGVHVSAVLPAHVDRQLEERTAMSLSPDDDRNTVEQLATLVDALQRHICTESYCLYIRKGAPADLEKFCCFWALWKQVQEPYQGRVQKVNIQSVRLDRALS